MDSPTAAHCFGTLACALFLYSKQPWQYRLCDAVGPALMLWAICSHRLQSTIVYCAWALCCITHCLDSLPRLITDCCWAAFMRVRNCAGKGMASPMKPRSCHSPEKVIANNNPSIEEQQQQQWEAELWADVEQRRHSHNLVALAR